MTIRVLCCGLGSIGLGIARLAAQRADMQIVAALDTDPAKTGRDMGDLLGGPPADILVTDNAAAVLAQHPDIALHATGSALARILPELEVLISAGMHVISTCEELAYPWANQPQQAVYLDRLARSHGVTVLGTGVNPGYAMDVLPLLLTAPCATVRSIHVTRVVDAVQRRAELQQKIGAGLSPEEFAAGVRAGSIRHVGLHESLYMLAGSLGWQLERVEYQIEPVIAKQEITTPHMRVQIGQVTGVHQMVSGRVYGKEVLRLDLQIYMGAPDPHDEIKIEGNPPIQVRLDGGASGDVATSALVVNAVPTVLRAARGLATMTDVGMVHWRG